MLQTSFFKGTEISAVQLRTDLTEAGVKEGLSQYDAMRMAEHIIEDMNSGVETKDPKIIYGAYKSHGICLLKQRVRSKGIDTKIVQ